MNKDWTGNVRSAYAILGASNHCKDDRADNDFYATDPTAINDLLQYESFSGSIWEPAAGNGHLTDRLRELGYEVNESDIIDRNNRKFLIIDFLNTNLNLGDNIITNPPYKFALEFIQKSIDILQSGKKIAMFLKLTFLEGQKRAKFFKEFPPETVYVYSARKQCAKNGIFKKNESSIAYAWFIWRKDVFNNTVIKWI
jgi:hypothetical protein